MRWFNSRLGRKPPNSTLESISEAQLAPVNWASSQLHLALLKRFLSAREAKDGFPDFWASAFGKSPKRVIDELVAHGALEPLPLQETIESCHTVAELKGMLSSHGLQVSGKKAELVRRLIEADPKGMEQLYVDRIILRCTPAASQAVSRWEDERAKSFETATDDMIAALRNRHFKTAICIADAYRRSKFEPPVHPAQEAMTIHPAPRSIEERTDDLATVFTMHPKILGGLRPEQWDGLYLNYAVWQLLGREAPEKCMPGFKGIGVMNSTTATRMLSFYVKHQTDIARWRDLGISKATIIGVGGCEACLALKNKTFSLDELPELPYKDCTCNLGCRCTSRSVLPY